jgi:large subunit ribosomal protein L24
MAKDSKRRQYNSIGEKRMQTTKPVTKPTKQRRMLYQAPDHIRYKLFAAPLSPELKTSHKVKTVPVRSGDTVRILRGDHKGFEGKITRVDRRKYRVYVEGLTRETVDGTSIFVPVHPSKIMITNLNLDDKFRKEILERKKEARKKVEKVPKEAVEKREEIVEEKPTEKKPKRRKKKVAKRPAKEKLEEAEEEKPKAKRARAKRKTAEKTEGGT